VVYYIFAMIFLESEGEHLSSSISFKMKPSLQYREPKLQKTSKVLPEPYFYQARSRRRPAGTTPINSTFTISTRKTEPQLN
jgi:hypothetical protein